MAESDEEKADEEDAEEEEAGDTEPALTEWALRGSLAGAKARDDSGAGREYSTDPPPAVTAAGADVEWLAAFHAAFKPRLASSPQDAVVSGLVVKKRRKTSIAVNKSGLAGLNENAEGVLSNEHHLRHRALLLLHARRRWRGGSARLTFWRGLYLHR